MNTADKPRSPIPQHPTDENFETNRMDLKSPESLVGAKKRERSVRSVIARRLRVAYAAKRHRTNDSKIRGLRTSLAHYLNLSSTGTWKPLARRFVMLATPTILISSPYIASVIPLETAAAR